MQKKIYLFSVISVVIGIILIISSIPNLYWSPFISEELNIGFDYPINWVIAFEEIAIRDELKMYSSEDDYIEILKSTSPDYLDFIKKSVILFDLKGSSKIRITIQPHQDIYSSSDTMKGIYATLFPDYRVIEEQSLLVAGNEAIMRLERFTANTPGGPLDNMRVVLYFNHQYQYEIFLDEHDINYFDKSFSVFRKLVESIYLLGE